VIRINLANALMRNMEAAAKPAAVSASPGTPTEASQNRELLIKVGLLLLPLIGLIFYEKQQLGIRNQELAVVVQEKASLDEKLAQVGSVDDVLRQIDQQKQEVDKKVGVVRKIFSMRKQKISTILSLQTHIPRSAWLKKLEFDKDEIKIEGMANSTDDAQTFASLLSQEKELFSDFTNKGISKLSDRQEGQSEIFQFEFLGKVKE
jgi:Tfp pilus assembly protein PilN